MALFDLCQSIPEALELLLAADEATQRPSTKTESGRFAACDPIGPRRSPRTPIGTHELEPSLEERHGGLAGDDRVRRSKRDQRLQRLDLRERAEEITLGVTNRHIHSPSHDTRRSHKHCKRSEAES